MAIGKKGITTKPDGTFTVQWSERWEQLEHVAKLLRSLVDDPNPDAILRVRKFADQLEIIADEIKTVPSNELIASRIYGCLKDHAFKRSFGPKGDFVPSFVHNDILQIMNDPFAHLTETQRENIRDVAIEVRRAGDGNNTISRDDATAMLRGLSIADLIAETQIDNWSKYLDFDPETGQAWRTDDE